MRTICIIVRKSVDYIFSKCDNNINTSSIQVDINSIIIRSDQHD